VTGGGGDWRAKRALIPLKCKSLTANVKSGEGKEHLSFQVIFFLLLFSDENSVIF
jgi:hypothetical protein